jgi:transposase
VNGNLSCAGFAQEGGVGDLRGRPEPSRGSERFGVSFASAIRWMAALRERGDYAPSPMDGDRRSGRVEAHADYILGLVKREPDLTLVEICDRLERVRGERISPSMLWLLRSTRHHAQKSRRMRASRLVRTSSSDVGSGLPASSTSTR